MNQTCIGLSGGVSRIWLFDPADFDFTQAAYDPATGYPPYTVIAYTTGAEVAGAAMLSIKFERDEAEYKATQSRKGSFSKWEHQLEFKAKNINQNLANWNHFIDAAGICSGLGIAIQLNTGIIIILGEQSVNGDAVDIPLYMVQEGSSLTSGKLMDDFNGQTVILKGDYTRHAFEFTGGLQAIVDME